MTQAGGPAALNGFLYQIIHHLGWLASFSIEGGVGGQDLVGDACLVLEPISGGDALAESSDFFLVEQYETRKDGTWALSDIEAVPATGNCSPIPSPANGYNFFSLTSEG